MNLAYLIIGGNKGNRKDNLQKAVALISERVGEVSKESLIYETAAWGNTNQPHFYNQVLLIKTSLSAQVLLKEVLTIEEELGRVRDDTKWMARTMDIDILFYNKEIINTSDLTIPHPYIQDRQFVLVPLNEIAESFVHPVLVQDINTLLDSCVDGLSVCLTK